MAQADSPVLLRREGAIAWLVLNRPRNHNALDVAAAQALHACCSELAADAGVRAVVVKGEGGSFGVGGDLASLRNDPPATAMALIEPLHASIRMLAALDAPVIASLRGNVAGGSMSLAMACDLAIAADDAVFNLAYIKVGVSCDLSGSWHLPRLVGLRNAMAIAMLGESLDAQEALRLGLVNKLVPAAEIDVATDALAARLAAGPTLAYGKMKRLMRQSFDNDLSTQLDAERDNFRASAATEDFREALEAFFGKRPPQFSGR
ncbi:enoyl-CoA hydratase/isomerase family protein [Noviherbaspirillum aerium]|uniref:enoyl-CoA hydratase/isomerase family protein n=1 Tax=Noviherbaspirillum aerium TaxID=2588497 RepID=UPI00124F15DD|nr:enoyl-CoA hydratase-related protein [Noviherbaspirillum aerium]